MQECANFAYSDHSCGHGNHQLMMCNLYDRNERDFPGTTCGDVFIYNYCTYKGFVYVEYMQLSPTLGLSF